MQLFLLSLHVLLFDKGHHTNMYDVLFIFYFLSNLTAQLNHVPCTENITTQRGTVTSNCDEKGKGCQNGRVSCLFPAGIHREFKASGISDNLPFSLLLPFGPIILGCLIADRKDQRPLPPSYTFRLPVLTSRQICHQLKGIKYVHNSIVFSTEKWTRWSYL